MLPLQCKLTVFALNILNFAYEIYCLLPKATNAQHIYILTMFDIFNVLLTAHSCTILHTKTNFLVRYFVSVHVSGKYVTIIRINNCIYAKLIFVNLCG